MVHVVVCGVSGSGKSTVGAELARTRFWTFADADAFPSPSNVKKMAAGVPLTGDDRLPWLVKLRQWMDSEGAAGYSTVLACSALRSAYRQ